MIGSSTGPSFIVFCTLNMHLLGVIMILFEVIYIAVSSVRIQARVHDDYTVF